MAASAAATLAEEDVLRADFYDLLAGLLAAPPDRAMLAALAKLEGGEDEIGKAVRALSRIAAGFDPHRASREFHALFIGLGRGELLPYASYYLTGFLNERPLAALRSDMAALGVERAEGVSEPEDNAASLLDMMAGMIRGRFPGARDPRAQRDFFAKHLAPWAGHFFSDLERAETAVLYAPVGAMGRLFVEVEKTAFRMAD